MEFEIGLPAVLFIDMEKWSQWKKKLDFLCLPEFSEDWKIARILKDKLGKMLL